MPTKDKVKQATYHRRSRYRRMSLEELKRLRVAKAELIDQLRRHLPDLDMVIMEKLHEMRLSSAKARRS